MRTNDIFTATYSPGSDPLRPLGQKTARRILELLAGGPMRPSALREAVGIRSRIHFSRYYMAPLMEKGLVARTDPENPTSPRQEYKLT